MTPMTGPSRTTCGSPATSRMTSGPGRPGRPWWVRGLDAEGPIDEVGVAVQESGDAEAAVHQARVAGNRLAPDDPLRR